MSTPIKVAMVGASGNTGMSVVNGLLASTNAKFEIISLTRPSSVDSEVNRGLAARGVHIVAADLANDPKEKLVEILQGVDTVVSCIVWQALYSQIPLAEAAKEAGVKRFVPCDFGTPAPRGVMKLDDWKDDVLAAIQRLYLPYTVIHVGWWSRQAITALPIPSGKYPTVGILEKIPGDGEVPIAYTDLEDVGPYVARIIADPRTLNKKVLAYTEVMTFNQVADMLDEISGEKCKRNYVSGETLRKEIKEAHAILEKKPDDPTGIMQCLLGEYLHSWGVRGDNTPEAAKYLGYLDFKELYPDAKGKTMSSVIEGLLAGGVKPHY